MAYKMGKPSLLKMVSALKNKQKKHFLERNKVGPIAEKKKKKKDKPAKPKEGDMKKYSDLEKYDDDKN